MFLPHVLATDGTALRFRPGQHCSFGTVVKKKAPVAPVRSVFLPYSVSEFQVASRARHAFLWRSPKFAPMPRRVVPVSI